MVKKTPIRVHLKKIIDALREGKKTWSELANLGIPEKSLQRALKENLQYWGLAEKKDNYWIWYDNLRVFNSDQEFKVAIEHSKKLLPAFDRIKEFRFNFEDSLYLAAKEHLRSYPEIYQKLEKLEAVVNPKNKALIQKHSQSVMDRYKIDDPFVIFSFIVKWNPANSEDTTQRDRLLNELKPHLESLLKPYFDIYREFSGDISLLELKIKMGTPLEGRCFLCPKVKIVNKGVKP